MTHRLARVFVSLGLLALLPLAGCQVQSSITPLQPARQEIYWELVDDPAATLPALTVAGIASLDVTTATAPTSAPATAPTSSATAPAAAVAESAAEAPQIFHGEVPPAAPAGKKYVKRERFVDPNQTERFAYRVNYDHLWNNAMQTVADFGYRIDRRDYRQGVIIAYPEYSAHVIEPWRPDQSSVTGAVENTMHSQRRLIRVTIQKAPNPAFYEVAVQALVERQTNPEESVGNETAFRGISPGFGRESKGLRSDYLGITNIPEDSAAASRPATGAPKVDRSWHAVGRDAALEGKILGKLFGKL